MSEKFNGEQVDDTDPAVYESQRDNAIDPGVTCAATCLSMLIQSVGMKDGEIKSGKHIEDEILADLKARYPESHKFVREDFLFLAKYAESKYGVKLKYAAMNKNDWIAKILNSERPFMTSTSSGLTKFGHIVLPRGLKTLGQEVFLRFNDPYGKYPYTTKESGDGVLYPASQFPFDDGKGSQKTYHTLSYA
jgi:hypothetical protein